MSLSRMNLACNRGALAIENGDAESATTHFLSAGELSGAATPSYASDLLSAGLGLCAIQRGELAEARRLEARLRDPPSVWYYDPFLILAFRSRMLERRGNRSAAIEMLTTSVAALERCRFTSALKLRLLLSRLLLKEHSNAAVLMHADIGRRASEHANFPSRTRQFD